MWGRGRMLNGRCSGTLTRSPCRERCSAQPDKLACFSDRQSACMSPSACLSAVRYGIRLRGYGLPLVVRTINNLIKCDASYSAQLSNARSSVDDRRPIGLLVERPRRHRFYNRNMSSEFIRLLCVELHACCRAKA